MHTIQLINPFTQNPLQMSDTGLYEADRLVFPKTKGAFCVLDKTDNYTESFGYQWNTFTQTQIDHAESGLSKMRFFAETNWDKEDLSQKNVLEVGSGAGRFSEVILAHTQATLYSIDYSRAVEANYANNQAYGSRLYLFQASIYEMPFAPNQFDKVVCLGVLQHTPDFKKSVRCLAEQVKTGGELVVDFYPINGWWTKLHAKYIFRPITKKWNHDRLLRIIRANINYLIAAYKLLYRLKLGILTRFLPICDIYGTFPHQDMPKEQLRELCILDTFDMFAPQYDNPQRIATVKKWFEECGLFVTWSGFVQYGNAKAATVKGIKK